jgi:hypothetical protein
MQLCKHSISVQRVAEIQNFGGVAEAPLLLLSSTRVNPRMRVPRAFALETALRKVPVESDS